MKVIFPHYERNLQVHVNEVGVPAVSDELCRKDPHQHPISNTSHVADRVICLT